MSDLKHFGEGVVRVRHSYDGLLKDLCVAITASALK